MAFGSESGGVEVSVWLVGAQEALPSEIERTGAAVVETGLEALGAAEEIAAAVEVDRGPAEDGSAPARGGSKDSGEAVSSSQGSPCS